MSRTGRRPRVAGVEGPGGDAATAYTRARMETGTLGKPLPLQLDVVSSEAQAAISSAAQRLRVLADSLNAAYSDAAAEQASGRRDLAERGALPELAPARALIARLELAQRELRDAAETVASAESDAHETVVSMHASNTDAATARAVLAGQEQERARLAEELHDGTAQALANVVFQTEILGRTLAGNAAAESELSSLRSRLQRELESLRAYINQLRPSLLEDDGLEDALRESAAQLSERTGIPVEVDMAADANDLDEAARAVALRVAQEALRNVGKHASASRAWLRTRSSRSRAPGAASWILEVGDDGHGFDVDEARAQTGRRHFGLRFMRERARLLGAELAIETGPAVGTVVRLSISTGGERSQL